MVGPKLYKIKQGVEYQAFKDSTTVVNALSNWLADNGFNYKIKSPEYSRGKKKGVHVNHIPKWKLNVVPSGDKLVVTFEYYAKLKLGTAIGVGILTAGISSLVGVGTFAATMADADSFVGSFWRYVETISNGPGTVVLLERWVNDGNTGNLVMAPMIQQSTTVNGVTTTTNNLGYGGLFWNGGSTYIAQSQTIRPAQPVQPAPAPAPAVSVTTSGGPPPMVNVSNVQAPYPAPYPQYQAYPQAPYPTPYSPPQAAPAAPIINNNNVVRGGGVGYGPAYGYNTPYGAPAAYTSSSTTTPGGATVNTNNVVAGNPYSPYSPALAYGVPAVSSTTTTTPGGGVVNNNNVVAGNPYSPSFGYNPALGIANAMGMGVGISQSQTTTAGGVGVVNNNNVVAGNAYSPSFGYNQGGLAGISQNQTITMANGQTITNNNNLSNLLGRRYY